MTGSEDVRCMPGATRLTNQLANGTCPSQTLTTWSCFPPDAGEQFRCRWDKPTSTSDCAAPPTFINASPTSGQEVDYMLFDFLQTKQRRSAASTYTGTLTTGCTASTSLFSGEVWGGWVEVRNPTAQALAVDVGGITSTDMMIYVYNTKPTTDNQVSQTCVRANDTCGSGNMTGADACIINVSIPANGSIWVFSSRYSTVGDVVEHPIRIKTR